MSADIPAGGGENKPNIKTEGNNNEQHGGRSNNRRNFPKKEKFLGASPSLQGHVFEAKRSRSEQVANYRDVDDTIKSQIGADSDPYVLESLEKETLTLPPEPTPVYETDNDGNPTDKISDLEMMKFKSRYDKYLKQVDLIEKEAKQAFSVYYGQVAEEMRASLKENPDYTRAYNEKDVFALRKMLKEVNFKYKRTEEPFKTLVTAQRDLTNTKQNDTALQDYYTKFEAVRKVVEELMHSEHGSPFVDIICRERKTDPHTLNDNEKNELIEEGEDRYQAMRLLLNADRKRYGSLIEEFDRAYLGNVNRYPKTCVEAYNLLKNWHKDPD